MSPRNRKLLVRCSGLSPSVGSLPCSFFYLSCSPVLARALHCSIWGVVSVPTAWYPWVLLVIFQLIMPSASFLGHMSGILSGLACQPPPLPSPCPFRFQPPSHSLPLPLSPHPSPHLGLRGPPLLLFILPGLACQALPFPLSVSPRAVSRWGDRRVLGCFCFNLRDAKLRLISLSSLLGAPPPSPGPANGAPTNAAMRASVFLLYLR